MLWARQHSWKLFPDISSPAGKWAWESNQCLLRYWQGSSAEGLLVKDTISHKHMPTADRKFRIDGFPPRDVREDPDRELVCNLQLQLEGRCRGDLEVLFQEI